jgi:hypothetical protein
VCLRLLTNRPELCREGEANGRYSISPRSNRPEGSLWSLRSTSTWAGASRVDAKGEGKREAVMSRNLPAQCCRREWLMDAKVSQGDG